MGYQQLMGRVRTKTIKKAAKKIVESYYSRLTSDFQINKRIIQEITDTPTKKTRNKIAGFVTHLMKRIQNGPVRGISHNIQEQNFKKQTSSTSEVNNPNLSKENMLLH